MTEVAFHFGTPDKLAYACRLLRKAASTGARVMVVAHATDVERLDGALWGVSPTDFVTHAGVDAPPTVRMRSSVLLGKSPETGDFRPGILVNLCDDVPEDFGAFERVIELVSNDDVDRDKARRRWKHYTGLGMDIQRHDLRLKASAP